MSKNIKHSPFKFIGPLIQAIGAGSQGKKPKRKKREHRENTMRCVKNIWA